MAVCKFWMQGNCRYGNNCRFEHPPQNSQQQSSNRFDMFNKPALGNRQGDPPYNLNAELIQRDLTTDRPQWILSCYGPGKDAPEQLFGGPLREQSFEEIRLHYMNGAQAGNPQGAMAEIEGLYNNAQQQMQNALSNLNAGIQFIVDARNKHPNRVDICQQAQGGKAGAFEQNKTGFGNTPASNPFGAPAAQAPSAFGAAKPAFGAPAFGQPAAPAFGQPAKLGASPFGQPSQTTSAFGQPAQNNNPFGQPAQPSAFGQASTLGAKPNPFGQPAQPSAFGQTSALGTKPNPFGAPAQPTQTTGAPAFGQPAGTSAFGKPSMPGGGSAFGQPAVLGQKPNPFGNPPGQTPFAAAAQQTTASPFGQVAQTTQAANAFGQPAPATGNTFGQPAAQPTTSPFGQPAATTAAPAANVFGQPTTTTTAPANPFGQPATAPATNPFGQPPAAAAAALPQTTSTFAQPQTQPQQPAANPFGVPAAAAAAPTSTATAAARTQQGSGPGPYAPDATRQHPDINSYSSRGPDNRLVAFKGKPVSYQVLGKSDKEVPIIRSFDGTASRIWFPGGAPNYTTETEAAPEAYADPKVQEQWGYFVSTGTFAGGLMPEVPPKREFCVWDF
ncbi:hypothetical protein QBC47DRAFT_366859 [Echria macrotheca]|uniref:C3H1-type domain-containing protein n=1 Tax=Echria macrotheca TaxID=438768 RepID=A0AAJ0BLT4_9PEZI|nr:hypothetical protein QBC47DRAFT_366859 [Echria macrotheca]